MSNLLTIGSRVRLTGDFLRNTGQIAGADTQSVWVIVACDCGLCESGDFVATNEPSYFSTSKSRHINKGNLEKCS